MAHGTEKQRRGTAKSLPTIEDGVAKSPAAAVHASTARKSTPIAEKQKPVGAEASGWPGFFLHTADLDNFVLVLTMGKVGSTAIARSLESVNVFYRHVQWLTPATQRFFDAAIGNGHPSDDTLIENAQLRLNTKRCYQALSDPSYASILKVVTAVRAPVDQILSNFFHNLFFFQEDIVAQLGELNVDTVCKYISRRVDSYLTNAPRSLSELTDEAVSGNVYAAMFDWVIYNNRTWFKTEFEPFFGGVLWGAPRNGWQLTGEKLILKFEEFGSHGERILGQYVQRPHFKLIRDNVGEDKGYGKLYRQVRETLRLPRAFISHVLEADYVKHFYSGDEISTMYLRWSDEFSPQVDLYQAWVEEFDRS